MKLILARHGETEDNIKHIAQGHRHGILSATGKEQAKLLGKRLKEEHIDVIYASDLGRAVDTAKEIIAHHPKASVHYDSRLRERHFGEFEGAPWGSLRDAAEQSGMPFIEYKPKGGESVVEMRARLAAFLDEVLKKEKGKTVLFVSHGGAITSLLLRILRAPDERHAEFSHTNTGISMLDISDQDKPKVLFINDTSHLR